VRTTTPVTNVYSANTTLFHRSQRAVVAYGRGKSLRRGRARHGKVLGASDFGPAGRYLGDPNLRRLRADVSACVVQTLGWEWAVHGNHGHVIVSHRKPEGVVVAGPSPCRRAILSGSSKLNVEPHPRWDFDKAAPTPRCCFCEVSAPVSFLIDVERLARRIDQVECRACEQLFPVREGYTTTVDMSCPPPPDSTCPPEP